VILVRRQDAEREQDGPPVLAGAAHGARDVQVVRASQVSARPRQAAATGVLTTDRP
jgi:hypothetical protein